MATIENICDVAPKTCLQEAKTKLIGLTLEYAISHLL